MKKRTLCLLLAGTMSLSLLSGCGDRKPVDKKTKEALDDFAAAVENRDEDAVLDALEGLADAMGGEDEHSAPAGDEGAFPRDPRWDEMQPGETAIQYYDIFIKSGMTLGEVVEAVESSDVYQEQLITWDYDSSDYRSKYKDLDYEIKAKAPNSIRLKTSNGDETVTEKGLITSTGVMNIRGDDKVIMSVRFPESLPGEDGTIFHVRDLPVLMVETASYGVDSALTFLGPVGDIQNVGQKDVEGLLDVYQARDPNTGMETERKTIEGKGFYDYKFYSRLPLSISCNGYSLWSCPSEGEPAKGVVVVSDFMIDPNTDRPRSRNGWNIDRPSGTLYWAADNAG